MRADEQGGLGEACGVAGEGEGIGEVVLAKGVPFAQVELVQAAADPAYVRGVGRRVRGFHGCGESAIGSASARQP